MLAGYVPSARGNSASSGYSELLIGINTLYAGDTYNFWTNENRDCLRFWLNHIDGKTIECTNVNCLESNSSSQVPRTKTTVGRSS
jgi:hypothetical protein